MFSAPKANVIESDAGFSIQVLGRTGMRYREGERELFIDSEVVAPGKGIAIFTSSIDHWDPPHTGEFISSGAARCARPGGRFSQTLLSTHRAGAGAADKKTADRIGILNRWVYRVFRSAVTPARRLRRSARIKGVFSDAGALSRLPIRPSGGSPRHSWDKGANWTL